MTVRSGFGWRAASAMLVVGLLMVSACGSDDASSGEAGSSVVVSGAQENVTPILAGAQENAVATDGVCYSWPNGTTDAQPCAVGLKGPGGGRVFYDAGSVQPWGRFLEVAPQNWNGTLVQCPGIGGSSCGTSDKNIIPKSTSDAGPNLDGYYICGNFTLLQGEAGSTGTAIGDGRRNTEVLSQTPECMPPSAVTLSAGYRGGGLADWYLPSTDELVALCRYTGRNDIGGFAAQKYITSTSYFFRTDKGQLTDSRDFSDVDFGNPDTCPQAGNIDYSSDGVGPPDPYYWERYVRPIRAFS